MNAGYAEYHISDASWVHFVHDSMRCVLVLHNLSFLSLLQRQEPLLQLNDIGLHQRRLQGTMVGGSD